MMDESSQTRQTDQNIVVDILALISFFKSYFNYKKKNIYEINYLNIISIPHLLMENNQC